MRLIDLTGQRFGRLTVIERGETRKRVTYWTCRCDCGATVDRAAGNLRRGHTQSCGTACVLALGRKPWPTDPRYLVGDDGSIVSSQGKMLRPWLDEKGYQRISIYTAGRPRQPFVHGIVCETFHGPRPEGREVAHLNGIPSDNRAANLAWKTHQDNEADKVDHGTRPQGEAVYCATLTDADVSAIRAAVERGVSQAAVAARYQVSQTVISRVVLRKTWKHVA